jgi:hypothetical protein
MAFPNFYSFFVGFSKIFPFNFVKTQPTTKSLKETEHRFHKCSFPNCIGSIHRKHVMIHTPWCSGSLYFNYKKYCSFVLLASVDVNYTFITIDVDGSSSDEGVFINSILGVALRNESFHIPEDKPL